MSRGEPSVYASLPATIIAFAQSLGIEREALLVAAGLSEADLSDPDELVPYASLLGVWTHLLARFPGEPLGLRYAEIVPMSIFGALGYALAHCKDARHALQAYLRFSKLLDPFLDVQVVTVGDRVRIVIDHEPRVRALPEVMEMLVGAMQRHARELVFGDPRAALDMQVYFTHPAQHENAVYDRFFEGVQVRFEADFDGTEMPAHLLDLPIPEADPTLGRHLFAHLEAQLASHPLPAAPSVVDRVRQQIEASLADGPPNQAAVAQALTTAPRTLQRKLTDVGTSFSELVDETRKDRAMRLLREPALTVQEVAYLLGYAEPRAFHRSFRRWTGQSAGQWRRAQSGAS